MKKIKIYTVDAFTDELFKGNPAGVAVLDEHLEDRLMQNIAKEMNLSETAFLLKSDKENIDFSVRYFTPVSEVDFCGHATIGSAWILGTLYDYMNKIESLTLETNIGIVTVKWEITSGKLNSVMMQQVTPIVKDFDEAITGLLEHLQLTMDDIDTRYKVKYAFTGIWHLMIPVKSKEKMMEITPNYKKLALHNQKRGIITTHLFTFDTEEGLVYTRDFAPAVGVDEDPVTGSASGALAGYLVKEGIINQNSEFLMLQGNSMNRLGKINIKTKVLDDEIIIEVGGKAKVVINGHIEII